MWEGWASWEVHWRAKNKWWVVIFIKITSDDFRRLLHLILCKLHFRRLWVTLLRGKQADIPRWNIATTIKVFGILEYLEYWNIWNIEISQPLSRSSCYCCERGRVNMENSQTKNPNIFAFSNNLRGWTHVILDQKSPSLGVLAFLPRHSSTQKPSPALANYHPTTPTHTLIYVFNQISRRGHLRPSTILHVYMSTCL